MADDVPLPAVTGTARAQEKNGKLAQVMVLDIGEDLVEFLLQRGQAVRANSLPVVLAEEQIAGSDDIATTQVSVGTSQIQLAPARSKRRAVTLQNHSSTVAVAVGKTGVTAATGFRLPGFDGAAITVYTKVALFGITSSGTATVSVLEEFDT